LTVTPGSVATAAALGTPAVSLVLIITATSVASVALVPSITVDLGTLTITPDSIASVAAVGLVTVSLVITTAAHQVDITAKLAIEPNVTAQLSSPLGITAQLVAKCKITKAG